MLSMNNPQYSGFLSSRVPTVISYHKIDKSLVSYGIKDDSDSKRTDQIIPPLNTDIRMHVLPEVNLNNPYVEYAATPDTVHHVDNFSWHVITNDDYSDVVAKKMLMHPVQNQHMCGSCWAMALSSCISDCFVVSGVVKWMPKISPTFLMSTISPKDGNGKCSGGNPAQVAKALESMFITDTTCVDYSWCANNPICTSAAATNHFKGNLEQALNDRIPSPERSCYFAGPRFLYKIDSGSEAMFIDNNTPADKFRHVAKDHIMQYGPILAGYAVLKNFISGKFTDPSINDGVYFDRADYSKDNITFSDSNASLENLAGLHAVEVVGWGLAKQIQYDNGKVGDVPYWWAKNSWGSEWGETNGYFKMAMYPWNKFAQFGKQINIKGSVTGGVVLLRCTNPPQIDTLPQIESPNDVKKIMPSDYYLLTPTTFGSIAKPPIYKPCNNDFIIVSLLLFSVLLIVTSKTIKI